MLRYPLAVVVRSEGFQNGPIQYHKRQSALRLEEPPISLGCRVSQTKSGGRIERYREDGLMSGPIPRPYGHT